MSGCHFWLAERARARAILSPTFLECLFLDPGQAGGDREHFQQAFCSLSFPPLWGESGEFILGTTRLHRRRFGVKI